MPLLSVANLSIAFGRGAEVSRVVDEVSFTIERGETLALVGESGSGKSLTALALLQLLPPQAWHPSGCITFDGQEIVGAPESVLRKIRGHRIGMVFQEPMTSLNPLHTIGKQIAEMLWVHKGMEGQQAQTRVVELLRLVALPEPEKRLSAYPHELSGGQRQRVMIAMALANNPDLLIADEPTTALDVTIQAQILGLLKDLQQRLGMALLLITHDLGIVRKVADRVCVMQRGVIVEQAPTAQLFKAPQHAYTQMLLASEPKGEAPPLPEGTEEILRVDKLSVHFPIKKGLWRRTVDYVRAVDDISFTLRAGETLGIVGESGSGKTTLGLGLLRLLKAQGRVVFLGESLLDLPRARLRAMRRSLQIVFQDPFGSLNPRFSAGDIVAEGLDINHIPKTPEERDARICAAFQEVGLDPEMHRRYPHEFSGGQRQRISIARALILQPRLIILDEPTSALDMSVQTQIVDLLRMLQRKYGLAYIFISHDLRTVRALAHRVLVMKAGKEVEQGMTSEIFMNPQQDYTQKLLAAALRLEG